MIVWFIHNELIFQAWLWQIIYKKKISLFPMYGPTVCINMELVMGCIPKIYLLHICALMSLFYVK